METVYDIKERCCGCTACKFVCPVNAIEMQVDEEGFLYPQINKELCIDCKKCKDVCAFQNHIISQDKKPVVYAVKHQSEKIRSESTSGGVFTALSDYVLDIKGVVYGVKFDDDFNVIHDKAFDSEERNKFRGSKYVQSNLVNSFYDISNLLKENKTVLFTGTPCQVAGLLSCLKSKAVDCENLITVDIVCHGVPSPLMWKNHIHSLKRKYQVVSYFSRSKIEGWHGHNEMVKYSNNKSDHKSPFSQKHKVLFYAHLILRPSCHNCKYTSFDRCSDITIADFWGIEKTMPEFDDNKGISLVLLNSKRGKSLFEEIKNKLIFKQSSTSDCLQPQLQNPALPSTLRNDFWKDYNTYGYSFICTKYAKCNLKEIFKYHLREILKKSKLFCLYRAVKKFKNK